LSFAPAAQGPVEAPRPVARRMPSRALVAVAVFLLLSLDRTTDAQGVWHTPLAVVGDLLHVNIDSVIPALKGFKFSGMEMLAFALVALDGLRRSLKRGPGGVAMASASHGVLLFLFAGVVFSTVLGVATGGSTEILIVQARPIIDVGLFFLLFRIAFGTLADYVLLGKIIVLAAVTKSLIGAYVYFQIVPPTRGFTNWEYMTNHGDSVLFTVAVVVLVGDLVERWDRRRLKQLLLFLPIILLGLKVNNRRLAWVQIGYSLLVIYSLTPWRSWKRSLTRSLVWASLPIALYVGAGWTSTSSFFTPVQILRSMVDTKKNRSAWDREVENYNLAMTMKQRPLVGLGFGHVWIEYYVMDPLAGFPLYHAQPHNQILGQLLFMGPLGFASIWVFLGTALFLAVRAYRRSSLPVERVAALACVASMIASLVQSYGDLGFYMTQAKLFAALAAAVAGKLAVATGAWQPRPARAEAPPPSGLDAQGLRPPWELPPLPASPAHPAAPRPPARSAP
jgi:hypothetical protein